MKIALVNHSFSRSHGGLERFSVNLATSLAEVGHEVHAFGQRFSDLPPQVKTHIVQVPRKPNWRRVLAFHRSVNHALKSDSFDVIYGLVLFFPLDIYRMGDVMQRHWLRQRYPFALWRWLNCVFNPVHLVNLWLERRIFKSKFTNIVTNSRLCKNQLMNYYGVTDDRIDVVYNGVDHDLFNPDRLAPVRDAVRQELLLNPENIAILHVSNNWRRKGLSVLLRAVAELGESGENVHVIVVGRGRNSTYQRLANALGIGSRLHLVGETKDVDRYYAGCDLFVLPTLYDPFSNACLEAMACSLPVITTIQNGASELIEPGENGYIHKRPRDAKELTILLSRCLDLEHLRNMGKVAYDSAKPFTRERNMLETLRVFEKSQKQQ